MFSQTIQTYSSDNFDEESFNFDHTFEIKGFSLFREGMKVESKTLLQAGASFQILIYPAGDSECFISNKTKSKIGRFVSVWVLNHSSYDVNLATLEIGIQKTDEIYEILYQMPQNFILPVQEYKGRLALVKRETILDQEMNYIDDDTVVFRIKFNGSRQSIEEYNDYNDKDDGKKYNHNEQEEIEEIEGYEQLEEKNTKREEFNEYQADFASLLNLGRKVCDCQIKLHSKIQISVHSTVLIARCSMFALMFSVPMIEGNSKIIDLSTDLDMTLDVLLRFLVFLYCNRFDYDWDPSAFISFDTHSTFEEPNETTISMENFVYSPPSSWNDFLSLLKIAHRYEKKSLKALCAQKITNFLTSSSSSSLFDKGGLILLYQAGVMYDVPSLKNLAQNKLVMDEIEILERRVEKLETLDDNIPQDELFDLLDICIL